MPAQHATMMSVDGRDRSVEIGQFAMQLFRVSHTAGLRAVTVIGATLLACWALIWLGPIAQPLDYHEFADDRVWLGIPNVLDVLSNVAFLIVGLTGIAYAMRLQRQRANAPVTAYLMMYAGVVLTAFGSTYYHLAPDNESLVWDRFAMITIFVGFTCSVIGELVNRRLGDALLAPLWLAGAASVWYWIYTERLGVGDVRWYVLVQFLPMLVVPLLLALYPRPADYTRYLVLMFVLYASSKLMEFVDVQVFELLGVVSGHTLKHLFAAAAVACLLPVLRARLSAAENSLD